MEVICVCFIVNTVKEVQGIKNKVCVFMFLGWSNTD